MISRYTLSRTKRSARCALNGIEEVEVEEEEEVDTEAIPTLDVPAFISSATAEVACVNRVSNLKNNSGRSLHLYRLSNEDDARICRQTIRGVIMGVFCIFIVEEGGGEEEEEDVLFLEQDAHVLTA